MNIDNILAEIDSQIAKLQQARSIIAGTSTTSSASGVGAKRGRPKGSKNASTLAKNAGKSASSSTRKRQLSPEGRKAIADAMKKRWAERKKLTAKQ